MVSTHDFGSASFCEQVLNMSLMLGILPNRAKLATWLDTSHKYVIPQLDAETAFSPNVSRLLATVDEARREGVEAKPAIIGPVTYLALSKTGGDSQRLALLPRLLRAYGELLEVLATHGVDWVQIDEPLLTTRLDDDWQRAFGLAYRQLGSGPVKLMVASYFGQLGANQNLAAELPVAGLHIDAIAGRDDVEPLLYLMYLLPSEKVLSLGVVDGGSSAKTDLTAVLDWLQPVAKKLGHRLWIAPTRSPARAPGEDAGEGDSGARRGAALVQQKLGELKVLATALNHGRQAVERELEANRSAVAPPRRPKSRKGSAVKATAPKGAQCLWRRPPEATLWAGAMSAGSPAM